ncbi:MAG: Mur ligase domain-containing protein, partial [Firmicutes bacterium]|nr:Mur ligase domain-containing protein [Bacillota bacterium]
MIALKVGEIAQICGAQVKGIDREQILHGMTIDSRTAAQGSLFVALPGRYVDGHQFVPQAWQAGAVALVKDGMMGASLQGPMLVVADPLVAMGQMMRTVIEQRRIAVTGITGSMGKTSV